MCVVVYMGSRFFLLVFFFFFFFFGWGSFVYDFCCCYFQVDLIQLIGSDTCLCI